MRKKLFAASLALVDAVFARLAEDLLVRHGPGDAGDWHRQKKEDDDLRSQTHHEFTDNGDVGSGAHSHRTLSRFYSEAVGKFSDDAVSPRPA